MTAQTRSGREGDHMQWDVGSKPLEITAYWTNFPVGYLMFWGDGTQSTANPNNAVLTHVYPRIGAYMLEAKELNGALIGYAQVVVRPTHEMPVEHGPSATDPLLYTVRFTEVDDTGIVPRIRVNWRDGKPDEIQEAWATPGTSLTRYLETGTHIVSVYDLTANNHRHYRGIIIDHSNDPDFTLAALERTVTLTVGASTAGKDLAVAWGDGGLSEPVTGTTATHTYDATVDTTYLVQLWYADRSSSTTKTIAIPGGSR